MSETTPEPVAAEVDSEVAGAVDPAGEQLAESAASSPAAEPPAPPTEPLNIPDGSVAIQLNVGLNIAGDHHAPGDVVVVPQDVADSVTSLGYADELPA